MFTKYVRVCFTHLFISFMLLLKKLGVRVEFFNTGNLKYMFDLLSPTHLKNSSSPLNLLRSSPCLPTILMIFLLVPFKRFSYFWTRDIPSLKLFTFFTSSFSFAFSSSDASRIDSCNSFLIISGVFFLFVFLTLTRNYK